MKRTAAKSPRAAEALALVESLQKRFVDGLDAVAGKRDLSERMTPVEWFRDEGRHGGGVRFEVGDSPLFNRGSVNVSQVHYDDLPDKRLASASALSTIIHPTNPRAPSIHMHFSWTELRDGTAYWRIMADLNPAIVVEADREGFAAMLGHAAPEVLEPARAHGDRYFYIPALERHRGVVHFYLEAYRTGDLEADVALTRAVAESSMDHYVGLLESASQRPFEPSDRDAQLAYHTVYFFQVLTLDRGTTSGLLVHDQNDVGILGSLPSHVDRGRLLSWADKVPKPQDELVRRLAGALPDGSVVEVDEPSKRALAQVVRSHYQAHPEALAMQASGDVIPPTVANHQ